MEKTKTKLLNPHTDEHYKCMAENTKRLNNWVTQQLEGISENDYIIPIGQSKLSVFRTLAESIINHLNYFDDNHYYL